MPGWHLARGGGTRDRVDYTVPEGQIGHVQVGGDAVCNKCSLIFVHDSAEGPCICSLQMITWASYEHDMRILPNFGWAQAACQTGPV